MTQPHKKPPAPSRETKPAAAETVTIEVSQRSRVRWGDRVYGPGRRLEVPRDQLSELEGEYTEVS